MKAETIFKLTIIPVHALYQNLYTKSDQHSIGQAGNVGLTDSSSWPRITETRYFNAE